MCAFFERKKQDVDDQRLPIGWIEQPTSPLRVARSTTELNGHNTISFPNEYNPIGKRSQRHQHQTVLSRSPRTQSLPFCSVFIPSRSLLARIMSDENNSTQRSRPPWALPSNNGPRIGRVGAWGGPSSRCATSRIPLVSEDNRSLRYDAFKPPAMFVNGIVQWRGLIGRKTDRDTRGSGQQRGPAIRVWGRWWPRGSRPRTR